ncbi:hypothetical protein V7D15_12545 [Thermoanaerobacter thermohydrosulfuricus]
MGDQAVIEKKEVFVRMLLRWWEKNKRDFPWRHTKNPYEVLVAEMLLRKTTAQQVEKIYSAFLSRYPNPKTLAEADEDELRKILRPLGMEHTRAKLLKKFGEVVEEKYGGHIPSDCAALLKLPCVGMYAANAVLSLVYSKDVPMVDTNFIRIVERVFGFKSRKARARCDKELWEFAQKLVPKGASREFNLAVLDLAAAVCTAGTPQCSKCPLTAVCAYFKNVKDTHS